MPCTAVACVPPILLVQAASVCSGCGDWSKGLWAFVSGQPAAAVLWPYPMLPGQEEGGSRGRTQHTFYICSVITFKCLGCKPVTRSPDSQALLCTL
jgi:hypothetical protein